VGGGGGRQKRMDKQGLRSCRRLEDISWQRPKAEVEAASCFLFPGSTEMVVVRRTKKDKIIKGSIKYEVAAGVNIIFL
jgi:hypothetical protein